MNRLAFLYHRRSLTFSFVALFVGLMPFGGFIAPGLPGRAHAHLHEDLFLCIVSFLVCLAVWINLILDVGRGYSPSRCSLASLIMLFASFGPVALTFKLARLLIA